MSSDAIVTSRDVLSAQMELRRVGHPRVMQQMEQLEPDLLEFGLEQLSGIHKQLLDLGARPRRVRRLMQSAEELALVLVMSLRAAHLRLWQDEHAPDEAAPDTAEGTGDSNGSNVPPPTPSSPAPPMNGPDEEEESGG